MCPLVQFGTECPDQPYQAVLTVLRPDGRKVAEFQTNENGRFRITLAPGDYIFHPESPNVMPH
ncbi:MAG: carboxypeptidase-like regulatory domain-containing protein, partial [Anaerolineales bacterium]|nr:carboxypeptidase-like regulatory domain-containing protein [Anaerolineales bacterium]